MSARIIMNSDAIERSIERLAMEILERNQGVENLAIVGIHTGGVFMDSNN
ncbi:pyrimidine operon attenuation protein; uracil phosphoribosyltransferase, partial [Candidatus Electrothrix marina]